jgi:uncharacterized membrane-anchored protein
MAETLNLGYSKSALIFGGMIGIVTAGHYIAKSLLAAEHKRQTSNAVLAFWLAYILTRPLGASIGDYMSQPTAAGGLGLGTTVTSVIFLSAILGLVAFLTRTKRDVTSAEIIEAELTRAPVDSGAVPLEKAHA